MDLLQSVRKEGSRGGRANFKWEDVKADQHRENYLGHSLMAPVGRWQKGRDLSWYAKSGSADDNATAAADARRAEIAAVKAAEEDAMAAALGLPVPPRATNNANLTPLGDARASDAEVRRALAETAEGGEDEGGRGVGFGSYSGGPGAAGGDTAEVLEGVDGRRERPREGRRRDEGRAGDEEERRARRREGRREGRRHRSRSRDRERHRDRERRRSRSRSPRRERRRERSRDRESDRRWRQREYSRSLSRERRRRRRDDDPRRPESRERYRSPGNERNGRADSRDRAERRRRRRSGSYDRDDRRR